MTTLTEKYFGRDGNGGQYYENLPRGDEFFDTPMYEPCARARRAWFLFEVSEARLNEVAETLRDIRLKNKTTAAMFGVSVQAIRSAKLREWVKVPRAAFLRLEAQIKSAKMLSGGGA